MKQLDLEEGGGIRDTIQITIKVDFDSINKAILEIFNRYPGRSYKVSQILSILLYQGIKINYGQLARRLGFFVDVLL